MNSGILLGAIAGDVIGSYYEHFRTKDYNFKLFRSRSKCTDDSKMTVAVAHWLLDGDRSAESLVHYLQSYGRKYPGGYGRAFLNWVLSDNPHPYNSYGNGSAMRVSPIGWAFDTLEETLEVAKQSAEVTHDHPEGIKGAQSVAACIFMARSGKNKQEIKEFVEKSFDYDLKRTCDEIRPDYRFEVSCQKSVPESIIAFLESSDFESAIRLAVSLGGDADTQGAIAGSIAEAYYGSVPDVIKDEVMARIPNEFVEVMSRFYLKYK